MSRIGLVLSIFTLLAVSGCGVLNPSSEQIKAARCKQMRHDIVFTGATPYKMTAIRQRNSLEKLQENYKQEDCP